MAETTGITWCDSTFNPWKLTPKTLAALQLPLIADAVGLEVSQLVARMAQRHTVRDVEREFRKLAHRFLVMGTQVPPARVPAIPAPVTIALEDGGSPNNVLGCAPQAEIALKRTVPVGIVVNSARSPLPSDGGDTRSRLWRVLLTTSVRWPILRGDAHLEPRLGAHFGALAHG